jgi:hypothetical protein
MMTSKKEMLNGRKIQIEWKVSVLLLKCNAKEHLHLELKIEDLMLKFSTF